MEEQGRILLTPGPLTTSRATREAMLTDWGSWDDAFNLLTARVCDDLVQIVHAGPTHVCVPLQGSGTFAVEATIGTLVPKNGKVLVPVNGAYCERIAQICNYLGRACVTLRGPENAPASVDAIGAALAADAAITHVAQVHCETSTGILNPLPEIAAVVAARGRSLIVDGMSSFAAVDIDARKVQFAALVGASGKCLEGVPGMGFVIVRREVLGQCAGNSHSLALDLHDQWTYMQQTGRWRYTPPTHVMAALAAAIRQFFEEGGQPARGARYAANCNALIEDMQALGLKLYLDRVLQAPIIVTFHAPADRAYRFADFAKRVRDKGFILYPGKLTEVETFRVGCIGAIGENDIKRAVAAVGKTLMEMGVRRRGPSAPV